ncbi:MAG: 50S ribosomal protein L10 [Spirochaetia bacterium]|jgi:large subunit ribosomal protein L10
MAQTTRKTQQYKVDAVTKLKGYFSATPDLIFSDFRGLTFPQMIELRAKLTEKGTAYRVVRNAFARIAMKDAGLPDVSSWLEGPTALAFLGKDPSPAAKIMLDFTRTAPLTIKGGVISGKLFTAKEVEALSRLPGRLDLLASLMGTMNAPLRNMMYAMNGVASKLVRTLAAVADKKGKEN